MSLKSDERKEIYNKAFTCKICGNLMGSFYKGCVKTVFFDDDIRKIRYVCSEECKQNHEKQYLVEEYKGNKIYCVNGKYMPYIDCDYYYDSIEGVKNRIDNPHLVPVTPTLLNGLNMIMKGDI